MRALCRSMTRMGRGLLAALALVCLATSGAALADGRKTDDPLAIFRPENQAMLREIPDSDLLEIAFPAEFHRLIVDARDGYLAWLKTMPPEIVRLRLLLGLAESIHDGNAEGLHVFFSNPSGAVAPEVLAALREAGLAERADIFAAAMAVFGPGYPTSDKVRSEAFAHSFLRVAEGIVPNLSRPPTAIDLKLRELGAHFPGKSAFRQEIIAHVRQESVLSAALAQARRDLSDDERLSYLQRRLLPGLSGFGAAATIEAGIERMPLAYRRIFVLTLLEGELFNGGIHQFFFNSSGAFALPARQALRDLGLPTAAGALDEALAMFATPYPVSTEERRQRHFRQGWSAWDDRLAALTGKLDGQPIRQAMLDSARRDNILPR
jgi:hypothetical protein